MRRVHVHSQEQIIIGIELPLTNGPMPIVAHKLTLLGQTE